MELTDRAAYLKGLMDGLDIDDSTKEGKVLLAMSELLSDLTSAVVVLDEDLSIAYEQIDDLEEEVEELEDELEDLEDLIAELIDDEDEDEDDDEDEDEEDDEDDGDYEYELECPQCGAINYVDEETLLSEEIFCGNCKAPFAIEIVEEDEAEEAEETEE